MKLFLLILSIIIFSTNLFASNKIGNIFNLKDIVFGMKWFDVQKIVKGYYHDNGEGFISISCSSSKLLKSYSFYKERLYMVGYYYGEISKTKFDKYYNRITNSKFLFYAQSNYTSEFSGDFYHTWKFTNKSTTIEIITTIINDSLYDTGIYYYDNNLYEKAAKRE